MSKISSAALIGIEAKPITIETDISFGMGSFNIVGLPDASVRESRDRIRAAIKNAGFPFPRIRITVNLAPAHIRKQGPLYDLPIALSILSAQGDIKDVCLENTVIVGELALDGSIRPIRGALVVAMMAKKHAFEQIFVPKENAPESAGVSGIDVYAVGHLRDVVAHLNNETHLSPITAKRAETQTHYAVSFSQINGQAHAKRALEIAAAGGHNVLLKGPPGSGKTLLARALPSILPPLTHKEVLEVTAIRSITDNRAGTFVYRRPFRAPHHSSSATALVGGGTWPAPGEVTKAHRGVLFLDELPEFSRSVLEHLRQPLEAGSVTISRTAATVTFPAQFLLIAAMNPCPCGFIEDEHRTCTCSMRQINGYQKRVSGPLLDRFDMIIEVPNVDAQTLLAKQSAESSKPIRARVERARKTQRTRYKKSGWLLNSALPGKHLHKHIALNREGEALVRKALEQHLLSARGYTRVLKVAKTIADLENENDVQKAHVAEALQFRLDDREI